MVMGILNVTPDSFSDGGTLADSDAAVERARAMVAAGAGIIDVGGESTRPGAEPVPADEEIRRTAPVIRALVHRLGVPVSIDTTKASVFEAAWEAGASMLNDVSGLAADPDLAPAVGRTDAAVVLMHRRGDPATMDGLATYADLVAEVEAELAAARDRALEAGVSSDRLILDPGLGFAKQGPDNWALLGALDRLRLGDFPLLVGPSRKRFLGELTGHADPVHRDVATAALCGWLAGRGVELLRVHAVGATRDAILVHEALETSGVTS